MEEWQKQFIDENLPELITSIRCDVVLLAYLVKYCALSSTDRDYLNSIKVGEVNRASALITILQTRLCGYEHLAKSLQKCTQTGAFAILLRGIQQHTLLREVNFGGVRLPLHTVCKSIDLKILEQIIESEVNAETCEEFLNSEPWTLANSTVPVQNKYYIPRTLSINTQIDPEIFQKLENDIFCIEGLELHQLSGLPSRKGKHNSGQITSQPDRSRNQIHGVTTRFILLERSDHFPPIAVKAKKPVHWLKYTAGTYWYVKSSPGSEVKNVSRFLVSKCETKLTEDEFIERCMDVAGNEPVFIYDSPGMGKSVLLARLAKKLKEKRPEDSVIYFGISELVRKVRQVYETCNSAAVKKTLVNYIGVNELGLRVLGNLLDSKSHQIQLFLDGYDEVLQSDSADAHRMLDSLVKEGKNIRIYAATRPHRRVELEEKFGVLGYNILPFDNSNKLSFFLKYWESEHGVKITDEIKKFAEHCLKTLEFEMSSEEGDIAGIPLQCRMLADIYADYAKAGGLISTETQFQLHSVLQVYKHFIDTKFTTFCTDAERQYCYDFHVSESLRTLFPENGPHFHMEQAFPDDELIYRIGILEPLKSDSSRAGFSHRTLAEYFSAEFLATYMISKFALQRDFIDLLFQQALRWSLVDREVPGQYLKINEANFENPVICRFLNFFLSTLHAEGGNLRGLKSVFRESHFYNSKTLFGLLESTLVINAAHLFLFLLDIYLDLEESSYKTTYLLRFKDNLQDTQNWEMKESKKVKLVNDLKKDPDFNRLVFTAIRQSSLHLVKLSYAFLDSVTGEKFFMFQHDRKRNPMYFALQRGNYQIFEYLLSFYREGFYEMPLLHWCLEESYAKDVRDKVQIVKGILEGNRDLLNKPHPPYHIAVPLLEFNVHFSLIKFLIEAGADLTQTTLLKSNIAQTTIHFSSEEYHGLVELIVSRNAETIFKQRGWRGRTPVHEALERIDLKSETLELLANKCNINFNDNSAGESELAVGIDYGRCERVINDIIRLGGDKSTLRKREKRNCVIF